MFAEMVLLCRNNAMINAHVKTQQRIKHRVWRTDPTRPKSLTQWPVTRFYLCFCPCVATSLLQPW